MNPIKLKIGLIIEKGNRILLIKEKYLSGSTHKWNMITGSWEESDGDIKNTSVREAKEETGLDVKIKGLLRITMVEHPEKTKLQFFFIAGSKDEDIQLPSKENQEKLNESIIDYKWFAKDEILRMPDEEFVTSTVASILKDYIRKPGTLPAATIKYLESETVN